MFRLWLTIFLAAFPLLVFGQATGDSKEPIAERVEVAPTASDEAIAARLIRILDATGRYSDIDVTVDSGVVFLRGSTNTAGDIDWAERLAGNTQDVVAVVNEIEISGVPTWDLSPAWEEVTALGKAAVRQSPLILLALVLLLLAWVAALWSARVARSLLQRRLSSPLLRDVVARAVAVPVFLVGLFIVLSVSGLTGLAVTVMGSTGLLGLVLGFAFRDIAENFLASVLISMNRPFAAGDRIQVGGYDGFVQSVNTRSTLLMTLEGNHVQIPNATIYKSTIVNLTANPLARFDFIVGIGYADSIVKAQETAMRVLHEHPAVIDDPEPWVLVENLGAATVNLRVYFWVDVTVHSAVKVQSAVIRQVKASFELAGISMPDEAREVVFPAGVPVHMIAEAEAVSRPAPEMPPADRAITKDASEESLGEGDFSSEGEEIQRQARSARSPEEGDNLLAS